MCDSANRQIVETVIQEFVLARKPFTAFDITSEARNRGADEYHGQMKGVVHDQHSSLINDEDYQRSLVDLYNVNPSPWLYHPTEYDVKEYEEAFKTKLGIVDADADVDDADADVDGVDTSTIGGDSTDNPFDASQRPASSNGHGYATTEEGRLAVRDHQWKPQDVIEVYFDQQPGGAAIKLVKAPASVAMLHSTRWQRVTGYNINVDGRLRIGPKVFKKANLRTNRYEIEVTDESVNVTPAK